MKPLLLTACLLAMAAPAAAQPQAHEQNSHSQWVMLGTRGGPVADPDRSQPANALIVGDATYLVDVGDGAAEQLAKAGIPLASVKAVVISHMHFDHTAGLFAILGLRWQTNIKAPLTIYGPPGTKQLVDGLLAAMQPGVDTGYGMPGAPTRPANDGIQVVEIRGGDSFQLGDVKVSTAQNSHYSFAPGSPDYRKFESLSLRFDTGDRSIVYTGDTGPSDAVTKLAQGADLLVAEMIDADRTIADVKRTNPHMPAAAVAGLSRHLRTHHLTPEEVGQLAAAAKVKSLAITHFTAPGADAGVELEYLGEIEASFHGPAMIGEDLDRF